MWVHIHRGFESLSLRHFINQFSRNSRYAGRIIFVFEDTETVVLVRIPTSEATWIDEAVSLLPETNAKTSIAHFKE